MARPPKNNCDYFSHDKDMRNHPKIKAIRAKFKLDGYSTWSMILELLTGSDGNVFEYSDMQFELMSGDFGIEAEKIKEIVDYCIKLELLLNKNGFINSDSLDERLAPVYEKRDKAKELSKEQKRSLGKFVSVTETTESPIITVTEMPYDDQFPITEMPQSKVKESKRKETKEIFAVPAIPPEQFSLPIETLIHPLILQPINGEKMPEIKNKTLYQDCMAAYNDFCLRETGIKAIIDGLGGKSIKGIMASLKTVSNAGSDEDVLNAWKFILINYSKWDKFHKTQIKLNQILSNLPNIINSIKNGTKPTSSKPESRFRN